MFIFSQFFSVTVVAFGWGMFVPVDGSPLFIGTDDDRLSPSATTTFLVSLFPSDLPVFRRGRQMKNRRGGGRNRKTFFPVFVPGVRAHCVVCAGTQVKQRLYLVKQNVVITKSLIKSLFY